MSPNYAVLGCIAPKTRFRLFAAKVGSFELYLTDNYVFAFVITNLAVFSFIAPITCFHLFATKLGYFELKLAKMVRLGKMRKLDELGAHKVDSIIEV